MKKVNKLKYYISRITMKNIERFTDAIQISPEVNRIAASVHDVKKCIWHLEKVERALNLFEEDKKYFKMYAKDPFKLKQRSYLFDADATIEALEPKYQIKDAEEAINTLKKAKMDKEAKIVERELLNGPKIKKLFAQCNKALSELKVMETKVREARTKERERVTTGKPTNTKDIETLFIQFADDCDRIRRSMNYFDELAHLNEDVDYSVDRARKNYSRSDYQRDVNRINELSKTTKLMKDFSKNLSKSSSPYGRKLKTLLKKYNMSDQDALKVGAKDNSHGVQYWLSHNDFKWGIENAQQIIRDLQRWIR